ncbi:CRISPR-associated protein, Cse3 family [Kytococcus aerolatus]|uniref:CRISPR-associated protein, Cse3 family n=1 Tax=Kytococcus aerolatus TaxID=592308 RepID=A0A212U5E5_9MICO|nr:type I-E CRISPR-associated protein Cas6/Cse3/CasE [Kytococcus aerolatus]SNC73485.1 CRISPR-associated protein, Cse3 family [Kytococcus aerolatus]
MSYLTRLHLNPRRRGARHLLASPQRMHAAVESSFPPGDEAAHRNLWRVDEEGDSVTLYLTSATPPDLTHVVEEAGWPSTTPWTTASYDRFLEGLTAGQHWQFRLTANPVHSVRTRPDQKDTKPTAHVSVAQQARWLATKSSGWGFTVLEADGGETAEDGDLTHTVIGRRTRQFGRKGSSVTLAQVTYAGVLQVTDVDALRTHLLSGMGRGKAYGCGLMTLARRRT